MKRTYNHRVPAASLASFSQGQLVTSLPFSLPNTSPTTLGKPTPARTPKTPKTSLSSSKMHRKHKDCLLREFRSCVPWWLKSPATTRNPDSSRTSFRKAQQEAGPRASWVGRKSSESRPASRARELHGCMPAWFDAQGIAVLKRVADLPNIHGHLSSFSFTLPLEARRTYPI